MRRISFLVFIVLVPVSLCAANNTVAVLDFVDNGGPGLTYLTTSIPDSISGYLADKENITVLEHDTYEEYQHEIQRYSITRAHINEVKRIGGQIGADIIILGSIAGNPGHVSLTLKAIHTGSGDVRTENITRNPIANIFDNAIFTADSMLKFLMDQDIATISVNSHPPDATVYVNNREIGKTPLLNFAVAPGELQLLVKKDGYGDNESSITVAQFSQKKVNVTLVKDSLVRRNEIGLGFITWIQLLQK